MRQILLATTVGVALLLAGCGGAEKSDAAPKPSASQPASATPSGPPPEAPAALAARAKRAIVPPASLGKGFKPDGPPADDLNAGFLLPCTRPTVANGQRLFGHTVSWEGEKALAVTQSVLAFYAADVDAAAALSEARSALATCKSGNVDELKFVFAGEVAIPKLNGVESQYAYCWTINGFIPSCTVWLASRDLLTEIEVVGGVPGVAKAKLQAAATAAAPLLAKASVRG
jgi:hypothetical protein